MTQMVASRPAPQTQTRGRRRVLLGLFGALIPPAAGAPVSTCRGLWLLTAVSQPSHNPVAPLIYRLDAVLSAGSIGGTEPGFRPVIGTSSSGVRAASTADIPNSSSPQAQISRRCHRDDAHRSRGSSPPSRPPPHPHPSVWASRGCFSGVSPKTTRVRRQLGGASAATGDHGCIINGAIWKSEGIIRINCIRLTLLGEARRSNWNTVLVITWVVSIYWYFAILNNWWKKNFCRLSPANIITKQSTLNDRKIFFPQLCCSC